MFSCISGSALSHSVEDDKDWEQLGEAAQVMAKIAGGINTRVMLAKGQTGVVAILERGGMMQIGMEAFFVN